MRRDAEFFEDREMDLIYIAKKLKEALRLESMLTESGVEYAVETDKYSGGVHAAAVLVGFHRVLHARFGKHGLQAQRLLPPLGDVDQVHLTVFEKLRVPAHSPSALSRSASFRPECNELF